MPSQLEKVTIILILMLIIAMNTACTNSENRDQLSHDMDISTSQMEISWKVNTNFEPENQLRATLTIHNGGDETFSGTGWSLYFNSIRRLNAESFLPDLEITHLNGNFFKAKPGEGFGPIEPGESKSINYTAAFFAIKKSDAPQGFYFVFDDGSVQTIENVKVHPFTEEEQVNRSPEDRVNVLDAVSQYQKNKHLTKLDKEDLVKITPTPVSVDEHEGFYSIGTSLTIYYEPEFEQEAIFLSGLLQRHYGINGKLQGLNGDGEKKGIVLTRSGPHPDNPEGYRLEVSEEFVRISAAGPAGIFYGVQSLAALISNRSGSEGIGAVIIEDVPAFRYRGMHLDVSRNFQSVEQVKRLLDVMSLYKLNKFHFHLTDDEGWRIEIGSLPELVEVGGRRGHTETERKWLSPAYGSGPDPAPGKSFGSGWYSRDEYIDILRYAANRHIEVIPEIDVPGHARAAIIAMKARAERLSNSGNDEEAVHYLLHEEGDESEYSSIQDYNDNVINVCIESTYRFMEVVIDEVIAMHSDAEAPLTTIHLGGDEVPRGAWEKSPACQALMEEEGIGNVRDLQFYFFDRLRNVLAERGLKTAGWEEIAFSEDAESGRKPNPAFAGSVIPHVWSNIWGGGTEDYAYKLANLGYEVVMSHASNFYFDLAYNKHYQEPGFYWAAFVDTKDSYSFIPYNLYKNAIQDSYGNPIPTDHFDGAEMLSEAGKNNILGIQGQLWTETVNEPGRMEYMVLPRLLGLAERAWSGEPGWAEIENRDEMWEARDAAWNEFANRIGQFELNRLDSYFENLNYRIPPPGAVIKDGVLKANSEFPGFIIRYTTDGSEPSEESAKYDGPVEVTGDGKIKLSTFNSSGRAGRSVAVGFNISD